MTAAPTWAHAYVIDPLERAVSTFVQQAVILLIPLIGVGAVVVPGKVIVTVLDQSAFAAALSIVTSVLTFKVPKLDAALDLALRVFKTFLQSYFGVIFAAGVAPTVIHAPWAHALYVALPVAVLALLKGLAAMAAPWSDGASLIPLSASLYQHDLPETGGGGLDPAFFGLDSNQASSPEPQQIERPAFLSGTAVPPAPHLGRQQPGS